MHFVKGESKMEIAGLFVMVVSATPVLGVLFCKLVFWLISYQPEPDTAQVIDCLARSTPVIFAAGVILYATGGWLQIRRNLRYE